MTVHANEDLEAIPTVKVDKGMFPAVQVMVTTIDEEDANEPVDDDVADLTHDDAMVKFSADRVSKLREGSDGKLRIEIKRFNATFEKESVETKELGYKLQTAEERIDELTDRLEKTKDLGRQRLNVGVLRERSNLQVTCGCKYLAYSI